MLKQWIRYVLCVWKITISSNVIYEFEIKALNHKTWKIWNTWCKFDLSAHSLALSPFRWHWRMTLLYMYDWTEPYGCQLYGSSVVNKLNFFNGSKHLSNHRQYECCSTFINIWHVPLKWHILPHSLESWMNSPLWYQFFIRPYLMS